LAEHLGIFEQAVLIALVRPQTELGKEGYGRAILKEVEHRLQRSVAAGAIYSTLDRLEAKGLVSSSRTSANDAVSRRVFAVTAAGVRSLGQTRAVRERLWAGAFPPEAPTGELDLELLARLELPGGSIRTVAVNAAFLAAAEDREIGMTHVVHAARREYAKLEKTLTPAELGSLAG